MIVYVDLEHDRLRQNREAYERSMARRMKQKYRFEQISGDLCLVVRYHRVSPDLLRQLDARAVLVSGAATDFEHYTAEDLAGLNAIFREAAWPTLGLCAGHQLLASAYGSQVDAMGSLPPGAPDPYVGTEYPQGLRQERGFMPVHITAGHPLLDGVGDMPIFFEVALLGGKDLAAGLRGAGNH